VVLAEQTVDLSTGVKLPYVQQGDPTGVPILFLHAIADSWRAFELMLPHLPESINAIVPTQRGPATPADPTPAINPATSRPT
jgi:non-heme chloroperoxidase